MFASFPGFQDKNIKIVNDVDKGIMRPTGANVKMMLDWLCTKRKKGDGACFFVFFCL